MKEHHHENLIQLYAVCTLEEPIYIVTEYMHKGALLDFLQKGDGCKLKETELIQVGAKVYSKHLLVYIAQFDKVRLLGGSWDGISGTTQLHPQRSSG